jgi:hypothetical protein
MEDRVDIFVDLDKLPVKGIQGILVVQLRILKYIDLFVLEEFDEKVYHQLCSLL